MAGYDEFTFDLPDAALTDFTLMLDLSLCSASWWAAVDTSDGTKGRAYKQDGTTRLAVDWIDFDDVAETGYARILWSGTLPTSGTIKLRIEPPQAANASVAASDTYGSDNAYDANWEGYWPDGGGVDRTDNSADLTPASAGNPTPGGVSGKLGVATSYDGTDDHAAATPTHSTSAATLQAWIKFSTEPADNNTGLLTFAELPGSSIEDQSIGWRTSDDHFRAYIFSGSAKFAHVSAGTPFLDTWHSVAMRFDSSNLDIHRNGSWSGKTVAGASFGGYTTPELVVCRGVSGRRAAVIQHVQYHSTARSDEWIKHEYDQANAPSTFWGTPTWVAPASGTTGEASQTLPSLSQSASGTATVAATAANTLPSLTQAATATVTSTATAAQSLPSLTQAASGTATATGTAANTLPSLTQNATSSSSTTGEAANALPSLTQAATGTATATATAAQTLPSLTQQAFEVVETPRIETNNLKAISRPITVHAINRPITVHTIEP